MADSGQNRTEQATPKRKADARAKGQVALSRDAAMAVGLLGSLGALYWMTPGILNKLRESLQLWLSKSMEESTQRTLSLDHLHLILRQIGIDVLDVYKRQMEKSVTLQENAQNKTATTGTTAVA